MTNVFRQMPIYRKLLLIFTLTAFISLLLAGISLITLELYEFRKTTQSDMVFMATIIGNRSTAALMFEDKALAEENLAVLSTLSTIQEACLYDKQGKIFAELSKADVISSACPAAVGNRQSRYENAHLYIIQPIILDSERQGTVYIHADFAQSYLQKIKFTGLLFLVLVGVSSVAFILSIPILKQIADPIRKLMTTVQKITDSKDYSLRATKINDDDLGVLVDAVNGFIAKVEEQNQALTYARDRYLALFDDNPSMLFNLEEKGIILSANLTGARLLGADVEQLQDCSIFTFIHPEDLPAVNKLFGTCIMKPRQVHKMEFRAVTEKGRILWVRASAKTIDNENQKQTLLLVCEDITETRLLNEQIAYQASHDALTGLANRSEFDRQIQQAVLSAHNHKVEYALCYLDLDQFKLVNDTCGHLAGDELLRQLGSLLKKYSRHQDFIARLGGDEFGILMAHCSLSQAFVACEKLRDLIRDFRFIWEGKSFAVGVSIGISAINGTSGNAVNLLKEADAACYAAKDKGRNRVHVYRPDDEELALRQGQMQWVEKIRQGLEYNRFCLYAQPIVPLGANKEEEGLHFETLLRYRDDKGLIIPPGAFLPAAERYSLAPAVDRWVIVTLFRTLAETPGFIDDLSLCSINLSGWSLSDENMLMFIAEQFSKWPIPPRKICFEITETAAITNLTYAIKFIGQLREQGCLFSLDDFGSGLSSFAYLKNLPVDFLKIDGLFVKDILDDKVDLAMVKSINEVGHVMNKKTIAEFVENRRIFHLLDELGIDYAQGSGIGKPVPLEVIRYMKPRVAISK